MKSMTPETVFSCVVYLFGGFCFVFQQPRGGFVVFLDPFGGGGGAFADVLFDGPGSSERF